MATYICMCMAIQMAIDVSIYFRNGEKTEKVELCHVSHIRNNIFRWYKVNQHFCGKHRRIAELCEELPDVQVRFRKGRGTRDQIANIYWVIQKAREFHKKNLLLLFWLCQRLCVDHNKLWKILKEMGIPVHLTCLLRNLQAGQETTVRTGHGTTDVFHIGKWVCQGCILSPCLFNIYAVYTMQNAWLDEA